MPDTLVGIAKMAAEGPLLAEKRRVSYHEIASRSWIGRCSGKMRLFDWTVNPYRGCEYGCRYCYARYTHEFMELPVEEFETKIYAKLWDTAVFRRDLRRVKTGESISFGSATDCYQPAERRFGLMTSILTELERGAEGLRLFFITKSDLIARDAVRLSNLGLRNDVRVNVTITTLDAALARQTEPFAPRPDLRLRAVAELAAAGVEVGVAISPVLPRLTDTMENLDTLGAAAAGAGAKYLWAQPLFLKECAQKVFFPWLRQEYPHLEDKYRQKYERSAYLRGPYVDVLKARVERVRARYGLCSRMSSYRPPNWTGPAQMSLFEG
ncbi:MAG: radical SAM protein [Acidobacteria bacterium]|nr:radical SAM protein [Acidobacteriota bacterium]